MQSVGVVAFIAKSDDVNYGSSGRSLTENRRE